MKCPQCFNEKTKVIDSRSLNNGYSIRRRRVCESCSFRFTTYEHIKIKNLIVKKRKDTRVVFDDNKVIDSIKLAMGKNYINENKIQEIVGEIRGYAIESGKEISSVKIGEIILENLKKIDILAYARYASTFYYYDDLKEFIMGLLKIQKEIKSN